MKKPELFKKTAKFWSQYFASSEIEKRDETFLALIRKLKDMGIEEVRVLFISHHLMQLPRRPQLLLYPVMIGTWTKQSALSSSRVAFNLSGYP